MDDSTPSCSEKTPEPALLRAWWVYLLRCADGSLYAGVTTDVSRRLAQHNGEISGGARYTRGRRPCTLVWCGEFTDRAAALRREYAIKRLSRAEKEHLIASAGQ